MDLRPSWEREHGRYLARLKAQREALSEEAYGQLIEEELAAREGALAQLRRYQRERREQMAYHEAGVDGRLPHDVASFKVHSGSLEQGHLAQRIEVLEREVFFLKGQRTLGGEESTPSP